MSTANLYGFAMACLGAHGLSSEGMSATTSKARKRRRGLPAFCKSMMSRRRCVASQRAGALYERAWLQTRPRLKKLPPYTLNQMGRDEASRWAPSCNRRLPFCLRPPCKGSPMLSLLRQQDKLLNLREIFASDAWLLPQSLHRWSKH